MLLLILVSLITSLYAQVNFKFHSGHDTIEFREVYQSLKAGKLSIQKEEFENYQILFVQGLSTNVTHQLGLVLGPVISEQPGLFSSFYQQKHLLQLAGIKSSFIPINPNGSCTKNGEIIAKYLLNQYRKNRKKIILISQSKGGTDILHGLVSYPEARKTLAGWIAYQPPHNGTYLAEAPTDGQFREKLIKSFFRALKGSGLAITEMRRDYRQNFMDQNRQKINDLSTYIPLVTLVTDDLPLGHSETGSLLDYLTIPFRGQNNQISFLTPFVGPITARGGGANDGIAMVKGTCLPEGKACIYLHGIDHFTAVMNTSPYKGLSEEERVFVFQGLLKTLLRRL